MVRLSVMDYEYNKLLWRTKSGSWRREKKSSLAVWLGSHCVDCGNDDIDVLDFDHRNPAEKLFTIGCSLGKAFKILLQEVLKCELRCANCHRKKTLRNKDYLHRNPKPPIPYDYMLEDVS